MALAARRLACRVGSLRDSGRYIGETEESGRIEVKGAPTTPLTPTTPTASGAASTKILKESYLPSLDTMVGVQQGACLWGC
jgi:hypothetical protein